MAEGGKSIFLNLRVIAGEGRTYFGVAVGEKGAPVGLLEAIWAQREEKVMGMGVWEVVVVQVVPRCEVQAASGQHDLPA